MESLRIMMIFLGIDKLRSRDVVSNKETEGRRKLRKLAGIALSLCLRRRIVE